MSRSVTFNGITQFRPGGLTKINANALAQIGLATNGVVGLIGEANSGTAVPGGVVTLDDPALAQEFFGSGPLADAVRVAFEPADDPRIPGGAFRVKAVVTNANTQSSLALRGKVPPVYGALSTGFGGLTTGLDTAAALSTILLINLTTGNLVPNAEVGNHIRIGQETREITVNTAGAVTVATAFSQAPAAGTPVSIFSMHDWVSVYDAPTATVTVDQGGLTVNAHVGNFLRLGTEVREITANAAGTVTLLTGFTAIPIAGQIVEFLTPAWAYTSKIYGTQANRIQQEFEPGAVFGSAWSTALDEENPQTSEDLGAASWLDVEYVGQILRTVQVSGADDGSSALTTTIGDVAGFTGLTLDNYFAHVAVSGAFDVANLRKIANNTNDLVTVAIDFKTAAGGAISPPITAAYEVRTGQVHTGTLAAGSTFGCTLEAAISVGLTELRGMVIAIVGGVGTGQRRVIRSNTDGISSVLVVDKAWITPPDATSVYEIRYVTAANASITGAQGISTGFSTRIAVNGAAEGADLAIVFTSNQTLQELVNAINQNTDYLASIPGNISATALINDFDHDIGSWRVNIQNDKAADATAPFPPTSPAAPWANHFRKDAATVIASINSKSTWSTAARSTGVAAQLGVGAGRAEFTGGAVGTVGDAFLYMAGAARGASSNTTWQNAFDALLKTRVNHVVPLISADLTEYSSTATFASVAAQLASHVGLARGVEKNERGGYIGMAGTRAQLLAQAATFGDIDVALTSQKLTVLNVVGTLTQMDEWVSAVAAAGMRAGMSEVGEPLTWKYVKTTALVQDASWDPADRTDANALIAGGVLFMENIEGKGVRWVRDLTTWTRDDNLAFSEGSVRDVVRYTAYGLRTFLEDRFTGVKLGSAVAASSTQPRPTANAASIKESVAEYLELLRSENIIVDSNDASGNIINAYHNIRVTISGDIARVRVEIFPTVGLNFQMTDLFLQLPTQVA